MKKRNHSNPQSVCELLSGEKRRPSKVEVIPSYHWSFPEFQFPFSRALHPSIYPVHFLRNLDL